MAVSDYRYRLFIVALSLRGFVMGNCIAVYFVDGRGVERIKGIFSNEYHAQSFINMSNSYYGSTPAMYRIEPLYLESNPFGN